MKRERMPTVEEAIEALGADEFKNKTLDEMREEITVLIDRYQTMARNVNDRLEQDRFEGRMRH